MLNIAVILAGGSGQRAGGCIPKQFKKINDKTILVYSLEKFNSAPSIDEITVVIHPEWRRECEHILSDCRISKVKHLLDGGKERYHSVLAALKFYAGRPCNLLIHDAVRPLVTQRIIEEVITELQTRHRYNHRSRSHPYLCLPDSGPEYFVPGTNSSRISQPNFTRGLCPGIERSGF